MNDPQRATGRTFRIVMKAITAASEGEHVYVVFHSLNSCSPCMKAVIKIIECWSSHMIRSVKSNSKTIEIDGGGKISFISTEEFQTLHRSQHFDHSDTILFDHYQGEKP